MGDIVTIIGGVGVVLTAFDTVFDEKPEYKKSLGKMALCGVVIGIGMLMRHLGV